MIKRHLAQSSFCGPQPAEDLWQTTAVWYAFRNATAHYGGFRPGSPLQVGQRWYQTALDARTLVDAMGSAYEGRRNPYLGAIQRAAEFVLHGELN